jgi:hypothetical protein
MWSKVPIPQEYSRRAVHCCNRCVCFSIRRMLPVPLDSTPARNMPRSHCHSELRPARFPLPCSALLCLQVRLAAQDQDLEVKEVAISAAAAAIARCPDLLGSTVRCLTGGGGRRLPAWVPSQLQSSG